MRFNSAAQEKAYKSAMSHVFKAAAFDIDGTLAEFGQSVIPEYLQEKLASFPQNFPIAICSGRDTHSIIQKLSEIHALTEKYHKKSKFYIIAENGGEAYLHDFKTEKSTEIFKIYWPEKKMLKADLARRIQQILPFYARTIDRGLTIIVHFPRAFYFFTPLIKKLSKRTCNSLEKFFIKEKIHNDFSVQDSGIGCIILPQESGKGRAIAKLAKHLKIPLNDFLTVGDKPEAGGNDQDFLNGKNGIGFTVGNLTKNVYPLPVFDSCGRRLQGPKGTHELLCQIKCRLES